MSLLLILKLYNRYVFLSMEMKAKHKAKSRGVNFHRDLFVLFSTLSFPTTL